MHGLIHIELERFAHARVGKDAWFAVLAETGLAGREYRADRRYEDEEALALVVALAKRSGEGPQALLEEFGTELAPTLVATYPQLLDPAWRTLDLLENTERIIHTALRATDANARPPLLRTIRRGERELVVVYASERQMCGVAKGLIRGVAGHYGDRVRIEEESCMLAGDASCTLAVYLAEAGSSSGTVAASP